MSNEAGDGFDCSPLWFARRFQQVRKGEEKGSVGVAHPRQATDLQPAVAEDLAWLESRFEHIPRCVK